MGLFNRLFTGSSTAARDPEARERVLELADLLRALTKRCDALEDRISEVHSAHRKLHGRFYATRGELANEPDSPGRETKAAILNRLGYRPGQAAPHGR